MKVYSQHACGKQHKSYAVMARCMFPRAAWIIGEGPYASVAWCNVITIMLFADYDEAVKALTNVNTTGCGGRCHDRHELIMIQLRSALRWTSQPAA